MSYWRAAGITFGQYLQITGAAVRNCLKQPLKDQVAPRGAVHFRERIYAGTTLKQTSAFGARGRAGCGACAHSYPGTGFYAQRSSTASSTARWASQSPRSEPGGQLRGVLAAAWRLRRVGRRRTHLPDAALSRALRRSGSASARAHGGNRGRERSGWDGVAHTTSRQQRQQRGGRRKHTLP